jgi:hypothetical protein
MHSAGYSIVTAFGVRECWARSSGYPFWLGSYQQFIGTFAFSACSWGHFFQFHTTPEEFSYYDRLPYAPSWTWAGWEGEIGWHAGSRDPAHWKVFEELGKRAGDYIANISLQLVNGKPLRDLEASELSCCLNKIAPHFIICYPRVLKEVKIYEQFDFSENWKVFDMDLHNRASFSTKPPASLRGILGTDNRCWKFVLMADSMRRYSDVKRNFKLYFFLIIEVDDIFQNDNIYVGRRVGSCIGHRFMKEESEFEKHLLREAYTLWIE